MRFNIHTPKTRIYNFVEGRKRKFQVEDSQNRLTRQICYSRVIFAHFSLETKKYGKITDLAADQNTKVSLLRQKFQHTKFQNLRGEQTDTNRKKKQTRKLTLGQNNLSNKTKMKKMKGKAILMVETKEGTQKTNLEDDWSSATT